MSEFNDLAIAVARIEAKLDVALAQGHDHEGRIRKLERAVWGAAGAGVVAGGGAGAVAALVARFSAG